MSAFDLGNEIADAATDAAAERHAPGCPAHPECEVCDYCFCGAQQSHEDAIRRFVAAMDAAGFAFALVAREAA